MHRARAADSMYGELTQESNSWILSRGSKTLRNIELARRFRVALSRARPECAMGGAPPPPSSGVRAYVTYQTHAPGYVAVGVPVGDVATGVPVRDAPPSDGPRNIRRPRPSVVERAAERATGAILTAVSRAATKAARAADHAAAGGILNAADTLGGKLCYVKAMMAAGGTSRYWRKLFNPPPEDALRHTFACHLRGAELGIAAPLARRVAAAELDELRRVASLVVGGASSSSSSAARADAALIPGVLFVSDFALRFSSDRPARVTPHGRAGGDYVRVSLSFERIARVTPHVDGAERWIGAVTVDAHRFWFTGFASFDDARTAVGRAGEAFLAKSAQHAREEGGGWWGEGGGGGGGGEGGGGARGGGSGGRGGEGGGGARGGGAESAYEEPSAPPMPASGRQRGGDDA